MDTINTLLERYVKSIFQDDSGLPVEEVVLEDTTFYVYSVLEYPGLELEFTYTISMDEVIKRFYKEKGLESFINEKYADSMAKMLGYNA